VEALNNEINSYREQLKSFNENIAKLPEESKIELFNNEYEILKNNEELFKEFQKIAPKAQREVNMFPDGHSINRNLFDYFLANDYISKKGISQSTYSFTDKGKYFNKLLLDEKYTTHK